MNETIYNYFKDNYGTVETNTYKIYRGKYKEFKVQMKCFFFIAEFERAAKIRKIAVYRFLISHLVPEL